MMKIHCYALITFFLVVVGLANATDCEECDDKIEEVQGCFADCADIPFTLELVESDDSDDSRDEDDFESLFDYCFVNDDGRKHDDIDDLSDCCNMDSSCKDDLDDAKDCIEDCFDPCLKDAATAFRTCIGDEGCDSSCFIDEDDSDGMDEIQDFSAYTLDCQIDLQEKFYKNACDVGKECCDECSAEQAAVIDCLFNKNIIPYMNATLPEPTTSPTAAPTEATSTAPVGVGGDDMGDGRFLGSSEDWDGGYLELCPVDPECDYDRRNLFQEEEAAQLPNKSGGGGARRNLQEGDDGSDCADQMTINTMVYNTSYASAEYMKCVQSPPAETDAPTSPSPETTDAPTGDDSGGSFSMVAAATFSSVIMSTLAGTIIMIGVIA